VRNLIVGFLFVATTAFVENFAAADTLNILSSSKDTTIFQNNVNNSSGGSPGLFAGTNGTGSPRRAPIEFDIASNVPAGATITAVQLTLTLGQVAGGGGGGGGGVANSTIELHKLLADWGEGTVQTVSPPTDSLGGLGQGAAAGAGDATWNARMFSSALWSTPGGDFTALVSGSTVVGTTLNVGYTWTSTPAMVSDVQGWLNSPSTNFGWMLKNADEVTPTDFRTFYSREAATAAFHPQLQITFTPVPEPGGLVLLSIAAPIGLIVRRKVMRDL
jgi:hypothetical protein